MNAKELLKKRTQQGAFEVILGGYRYYVPLHMRVSLIMYELDRVPVGGFLTFILSNDFVDAVAKADGQNLRNLPAYAYYLYNYMPSDSWGSKEKVKAWLNKKHKEI